jgi:release factor glutamine methyltransferase
MKTIHKAILHGVHLLTDSDWTVGSIAGDDNLDYARIDSEVLLMHVLNKNRTFLFTHPEQLLSDAEFEQFNQLLHQRAQGEPIAYLIQHREFWSLPLKVTKHTLIPRPETECLVERALYHLRDIPSAQILDLGTGTGAVALAIAHERPDCHITAVDVSLEALDVARYNAMTLHLSNITFTQSDWLTDLPLDMRYHVITSNPPYLSSDDPHLQQGDLRYEPKSALMSGANGLEAIIQIAQQARNYLLPDGWLCLEHGYEQKAEVCSILNKYGYIKISSYKDYQGHDRISEASVDHGCF